MRGSACACGRVTITRTSAGDEGHQRGCDLLGIVAAAALDPAAVVSRHECGEPHAVVIGGDGSETAPPDHGDARSLGLETPPRFGVIGSTDEMLLALPHLKREVTLPILGDLLFRSETVPDLAGELQAVEAARRQDDRIEPPLAALPQSRIDVAAQGLDREPRLEREQLRFPPDRGRADAHLRPQPRTATEGVTSVFALEIGADRKTFRVGGSHVL